MEQEIVRNRSLDGVRGIAILIVFLHHHAYLNSGWLGVDLFFVLSGYLITSILRRCRTDRFYWQRFWIKRFTRIFPPLVLLLIAVALIYRVPFTQTGAYLFSLGDVATYLNPFDPLGPLWSLAIEEHFYILWPFAVKLLPRRKLIYLLCGMLVGEPILRAISCIFVSGWRFDYYLTPFRFDGLALGCMLAVLLESEEGKKYIAKWSVPALVGSSCLWFALRFSLGIRFTREEASFTYNSLAYSIISLASCAAIGYLVTHPESRTAIALSSQWLTFTGTISYGLYLYQLLIRELLTSSFHLSARKAIWIDVPLTFLIAWLSYVFLERPLMDLGSRKVQKIRHNEMSVRA